MVYLYDLNDIEKGVAAWEDFLRLQPAGPQSDRVRADLQNFKARLNLQESGGELPPDHPPIDGGATAPPPEGGESGGYFPKPDQP